MASFPGCIFRLILAATVALAAPGAARAEGAAGAYLAARHAVGRGDHRAAAEYFLRALSRDPGNPVFMESVILAHVALGEVGRVVPTAEALVRSGHRSQPANLVLAADRLQRGDFRGVIDGLAGAGEIGPAVDALLAAWSELGLGRMSEALEGFDRLARRQGMAPFALYHTALALATAGDFEGAARILSGEAAGPLRLSRRGVIGYIQILSQLERFEDALRLAEDAFGGASDPLLDGLKAELRANRPIPFTLVRDARDGAAEVFFALAEALRGEASDGFVLLYARIAEHLRPQHIDAILLAAQLLEAQGQFGLAVETYGRVPRDDALFHLAEIGRAEALYRGGDAPAAIAAAEALTVTHPGVVAVHVALGDLWRFGQRHDEAARAYDRAIALIETPEPRHWGIFYNRGMMHERAGRWPLAEADFRTALALSPGQPHVLNYLGYSWVEMRINLDEALAMIERAVAAAPEDGYIADSLGWALYRLGRYDEALPQMERAVALMASDPVINDHLGDVYWAVGRRREAGFQWRRALAFGPEDKEALRIRRKLEVGLDRVLEEEGEPPLPARADAD